MTFEQWMQLAGTVCGVIASAASARWGHNAILGRLDSYVTVAEYREKVSALHAENNDLKIRVAVLEERARNEHTYLGRT